MFIPLFYQKLLDSSCSNILLAGMGGGYDVFTAIPLYFELLKMGGKNVFLSNLSFTEKLKPRTKTCDWLSPDTVEVQYSKYDVNERQNLFAESSGFPNNYFPEWHLSKWFFEKHNSDVPVYTFALRDNKLTVPGYQVGLEEIIKKHSIDTIVLIDAGVDSLLRHDEEGLGTVGEDLMSILATDRCQLVKNKFLLTVGLGTEGGISEYDFLENWAAIQNLGGWLGSVGWHPEISSVKEYMDAYYSCVPTNSTINAQIIAGIEGHWKHYCPKQIVSRMSC